MGNDLANNIPLPTPCVSSPCPRTMARLNFRWPFLLAMLSTLLASSAATVTMNPGDTLADGKFLNSTGGTFRLGFFTPGNSSFRYLGIWYGTISEQTVIWVANRERGINDSTGVLSFHGNGSLVLSDARGEVYWLTGAAAGVASPVARLLDNANFVVINDSGSGTPAWQSFDYPTDTLLPGMKLGWDLRAGRNRKITPWRSDDDPAPGDFSVGMDERDDLQIYLLHKTPGARQYNWRSGPWNGQRFSGIPEMSDYDNDMYTFFFHNGSDEVYFQFDTRNKSELSMLVAQTIGVDRVVDMLLWDGESWGLQWSAPKDLCDSFSTCGPFGVCDANSTSPKCSCLQGFERGRSPQAGSFSDGCARRTALDCRHGTDGFVKVTVAKRPDTSAALVQYSVGLDQCRKWCLDDCTCTAYANAEVTGAGCTLWFDNLTDIRGYAVGGSDLNVRLAAADLDRRQSSAAPPTYVVPPSVTVQSASSSSQKKKSASSTSKRVFPVAATAVGALLGTVVLGWICWFLWRRRTKTTTERVLRKNGDVVAAGSGTKTKKNTSNAYQKGTSAAAVEDLDDLPLMDFTSIAAATDGFSAENKLGEGGFGPVYVGRLEDGQEVAVKRLARNSVQGLNEFKNEVVLIAKLQHRNLVRLLGYCIQGDEKILVYEYMPNKSLDAFLFDKAKGSLLDWNTRYKIIKGIARGLLYLHQDSRLRIIHRDLKASNVLLDKEMNPKISDFGMARMFSGDQTEANTRRVVGTYGYMSPEYIMEGHFSVKSDVFSFGVVLLEIVSGERNRAMYLSDPNLNLLGYAWSLWKASKWMEMADSSIVANGFPTVEVLKCIKVGLLCVQERPEDRPTMATVVEMWGDNMESLPQPKQPAFMATRGPFEVWSLSKGKLCSINEVTVTDVCDGR